MNFFKKIRENYNLKLVNEFIQNKNFKELKLLLTDLYSKDLNQLHHIFNQNQIKLLDEENTNNDLGLIWVNSYLKDDTKFLTDFFNFYFSQLNIENKILNYQNFILQINQKLGYQEMRFNQFVNFSNFYQYCLKNFPPTNFKLIENQTPFYEINKNIMFTHLSLTKCFFYIIRDPMEVISIITNESNDIESSINQLLNLEQKFFNYKSEFSSIDLPLQDWATNVDSWTGENVINSFNGYIFNFNEYYTNPITTLAEVIAHLNQTGFSLDLNYQLIEQFVQSNVNFSKKIEVPSISNQKKKIIRRQIEKTANFWGFQI